jgi:hypothetical protein
MNIAKLTSALFDVGRSGSFQCDVIHLVYQKQQVCSRHPSGTMLAVPTSPDG